MFEARWKIFDQKQLEKMRNLPDKMSVKTVNFIKKKIRPLVSLRVDERLRVAPPPRERHGRVKWTSIKQYLAFFATGGFGGGIPYTRTGKGIKSWKVRGNYYKQSASISISTTDAAQEFITGPRQQFFHTLTGWPRADDVIEDIALEVHDKMSEFWLNLTGELWGS